MSEKTYHLNQRVAVLAAVLYPVLFAAVMFWLVMPGLRTMMEAV